MAGAGGRRHDHGVRRFGACDVIVSVVGLTMLRIATLECQRMD